MSTLRVLPARWAIGVVLTLLEATAFAPARGGEPFVWVEGEACRESRVTRNPGWYDQVPKSAFSGGDFLSHFAEAQSGEAAYEFTSTVAGDHTFWLRLNPHDTTPAFQLNGGDWKPIGTSNAVQVFTLTGWDLRFLGWVNAGLVSLKEGTNTVRIRFDGRPKPHGMLDCFVFTRDPFEPWGIARPDQAAAQRQARDADDADWLDFPASKGASEAGTAIDLRGLNEKVAGEHGRIEARDGRFVHGQTGEPVRFWAVNGPPSDLKGEALKASARRLAARGVNLVRVHGAVFDEKTGVVRPEKVAHLAEVVEAMKVEGVYTHLSIYFPLWFKPQAGLPWLEGYDGSKNPFAALLFNPGFQKQWEGWWRAVLEAQTPSGVRLADEPALFGVEIQNEDSFFFWTFNEGSLPAPQLEMLERQFGDWLVRKHGSLEKALAAWGSTKHPRDRAGEGRIGFRPLWNLANERTARDRDTAAFLYETQAGFYRRAVRFFRDSGFPGLVTPSNWTTASAEVLGPIEKLSYTEGDFLDRHGYFGCRHNGLFSEWSLRDGHTYCDRSALRFQPEEPGRPLQFNHPAMDVEYAGKPSMISETTWTRPNRYRSEAPLFYAVYGALQDTDAIVHFAQDGEDWSVKPRFWMQPWTLMAPSQMGQFPAAALIYRRGLVKTGEILATLSLSVPDSVLGLEGIALPQDAAFDELRLKDVPSGARMPSRGQRIDPLIHLAGRTRVLFSAGGGQSSRADLAPFVDRKNGTVTSSGGGELKLDYRQGVLTIDAPRAQGASGNLRDASRIRLQDLTVESAMDNGHLVAVSLDDQPLATSKRMLLQVMSEERNHGWRTIPQGSIHLIERIGVEPWQIRRIRGVVAWNRPDAARLEVTALDPAGKPTGPAGHADRITLRPDTLYYLVTEPTPGR